MLSKRLTCLLILLFIPALTLRADTVLWQIGVDDGSRDEFTGGHPDRLVIPDDWQARTAPGSAWPEFVKNAVANRKKPVVIDFTLGQVPEHGAELDLGIFGSTKLTPQVAVYLNGTMAGLIQTWGLKGTKHGKTHTYRRVYRLYLPPQLLRAGENELRLGFLPQPYGSNPGMDYFSWDFLRLRTLDQAPAEPVHGAVVYAGTNMTLGADGPKAFRVNEHVIRMAPPLLEWLGIAHSGNLVRAAFWSNVSRLQTHRRELLETYRDLNMRVVLNTLYLGNFTPDGEELPAEQRTLFDEYMSNYSDLVQYVEVSNEPGLIGPIPYENVLAFTKYVRQAVPEHVSVMGPGWAYNTWAGDAQKRRSIEAYCDVIGGHAYGLSFNNTPGGSFVENVLAYAPLEDGLPKPFINTEFGSNEWHHDWDAKDFTTQPHAAAFDRNMRAHVAVATGFMQHAAFFAHAKKEFEKFSLFADVEDDDWENHDPLDTAVWPGIDGQDSRVQTFRRLALAYSTHGAPLPWTLLNAEALAYQPVYIRCVDTSALDPLPGSGGASDKVLLNFVNFSDEAQTLRVRVTLPRPGVWAGKRIGPGDTLREATQAVTLTADPGVAVEVELPPRESVQFILDPPGAG